jgi:site-specific DNA-cytosine methylase
MVGRRLDASGTRKDNDKSIAIKQMIEVRDDDKTNCLTTVTKDSILVENMSWRKLTPLECERLQTVPDNFTEGVSNTQRYKMLGNGWTCDVIAHILKGL